MRQKHSCLTEIREKVMLHDSIYLPITGEQTVKVAGPEAKQDSKVFGKILFAQLQ